MAAIGTASGNPGLLRRLVPFAADLGEHRELLRRFTLRYFELTIRGSHLGLVWSFLNPLLMLSLYFYVFGHIFRGHFGVLRDETPTDFGLGLFLGLTYLGFITESMSIAPTIITGNPNFVKKVIFPLEILPAAQVGASFMRMLIGLALALGGAALLGRGVHPGWLWLLAILPPFFLLALGVSWLFASLGVFIQDLTQLVAFLAQVVMYISAVFYPPSRMSPQVWRFLRFNPLLLLIDLSRDAVLWSRPVSVRQLAYVWFACTAAAYLGHLAFRRLRPAFADVL